MAWSNHSPTGLTKLRAWWWCAVGCASPCSASDSIARRRWSGICAGGARVRGSVCVRVRVSVCACVCVSGTSAAGAQTSRGRRPLQRPTSAQGGCWEVVGRLLGGCWEVVGRLLAAYGIRAGGSACVCRARPRQALTHREARGRIRHLQRACAQAGLSVCVCVRVWVWVCRRWVCLMGGMGNGLPPTHTHSRTPGTRTASQHGHVSHGWRVRESARARQWFR
jgi:hypothetical protein